MILEKNQFSTDILVSIPSLISLRNTYIFIRSFMTNSWKGLNFSTAIYMTPCYLIHFIKYLITNSRKVLRFSSDNQAQYFSHMVTKFITLRVIKYVHINGKYIKRNIFWIMTTISSCHALCVCLPYRNDDLLCLNAARSIQR